MKNVRDALILLLVVAVVWVGLSAYFSANKVDVNPNANTYITNINPTFQTSVISSFSQRVEELPVSPQTFRSLIESED